jgi:hypothetical protein
MPFWFMDAEKLYQNEYWSNRYVIEADNLDDASVTAAAIRLVEVNCTHSFATLTKYRVSSDNPFDDVYQIINDNRPGTWAWEGAVLPLFNRVRIDFNTVGGGRPSRKYWAPPLTESDVNGNQLEAATISHFNTAYVAALLAIEHFVDVDGQQFSSGSVFPSVAMRQLRRGSKRKQTPVIPGP